MRKFIDGNKIIRVGSIILFLALLLIVARNSQANYDAYVKSSAADSEGVVSKDGDIDTGVDEPGTGLSEDGGLKVDFEALQAKNADVYAWIYIPGTKVNYPVVQSADTYDYYLKHNVDKVDDRYGAIYTNIPDAKDFSGFVSILYGHNMNDGAMFGSLRDFYEEAFFEEHPYIYIYTAEKKLVYEIIKAEKHNDSYLPYEYDDFSDEGIKNFVKMLKEESQSDIEHNREADFGENDKYIVLSTCIKNQADKRYLLIGKFLNEMEINE